MQGMSERHHTANTGRHCCAIEMNPACDDVAGGRCKAAA